MQKKVICLLLITVMLIGCVKSEGTNSNSEAETQTDYTESMTETDAPPVQDYYLDKEHRGFSSVNRILQITNVAEYNMLKGDRYTDTPAEGNLFLVLFLKIINRSNVQDYINPYRISADLDGTECPHTFLYNDPAGCQSIFRHIGAQTENEGFIVWEVPMNWKTFNITFDNWIYDDLVSIHITIEKDNIEDWSRDL